MANKIKVLDNDTFVQQFEKLNDLMEEVVKYYGEEAANSLEVVKDTDGQKYLFVLKSKDGTVLSTYTMNIPADQIFVRGWYDKVQKELILVLTTDDEIHIPLGDILDELSKGKANYVTKAEYDALSEAKKLNGQAYFITDGDRQYIYRLDKLVNGLNIDNGEGEGSIVQKVNVKTWTFTNTISPRNGEVIETGAVGKYSTVIGGKSRAESANSHAEGYENIAAGLYSHAEGKNTHTAASESHAEGLATMAASYGSHSEGYKTKTSGSLSHAEGNSTITTGMYAHSEGTQTEAHGDGSHTEGFKTYVDANASEAHAEGRETIVRSSYSHAEGYLTNVENVYAHAEGVQTSATGAGSHAEGFNTIASVNYSTVVGKYNKLVDDSNLLFAVGNGTGDDVDQRSDAIEVYKDKIVVDKEVNFINKGDAQNGAMYTRGLSGASVDGDTTRRELFLNYFGEYSKTETEPTRNAGAAVHWGNSKTEGGVVKFNSMMPDGQIISTRSSTKDDDDKSFTTKDFVNECIREIFRYQYYIQYPNTLTPAEIYGGKWQEYLDMQGRVPVGAGSLAGNEYPFGTYGGEAKHVLTIAEMPIHSHSAYLTLSGCNDLGSGYASNPDDETTGQINVTKHYYSAASPAFGVTVGQQGASNSHNNMQPYVVVRYWKYIGKD